MQVQAGVLTAPGSAARDSYAEIVVRSGKENPGSAFAAAGALISLRSSVQAPCP